MAIFTGIAQSSAEPHFKATAIGYAALKVLQLPGIHTVRVSWKPADQNDAARVRSIIERDRVKSQLLTEAVQHRLVLGGSFDAFLNTLGSHTRRNLRVYRRRVEQKGWKFVSELSAEQVQAAFVALEKHQGAHKSSKHYLRCCRTVLNAVPGSVYAGICDETGEWVSLAAGWVRKQGYFMLVQLNDARRSQDSVSTVMRSYLIEHLIGSGTRMITFVGGSSELLRRFCETEECLHYLFERRSPVRGLRRFAASVLFRHSMIRRIVLRSTDSEQAASSRSSEA